MHEWSEQCRSADGGATATPAVAPRHVDHSVGLAEVARAVSRVRGGGGGGDGGDGGAADGGVAGEGASGSFVFDLHPDRPRRRGILQGQDKYVPFNEVGAASLGIGGQDLRAGLQGRTSGQRTDAMAGSALPWCP